MMWPPTLFVVVMYVVTLVSLGNGTWYDMIHAHLRRSSVTLLAIIGVMAASTLYNMSDAPWLGKVGWALLILVTWLLLAAGYVYDLPRPLVYVAWLIYPPVMFMVTGGLSPHLHEHTVKWLIFIAVPGFVVTHLPSEVRRRKDIMLGVYAAILAIHLIVFGDMYRRWYSWLDEYTQIITASIFTVLSLAATAAMFRLVDWLIKVMLRRRYSLWDIICGRQVADALAGKVIIPPSRRELRRRGIPREQLPPHIVWQARAIDTSEG